MPTIHRQDGFAFFFYSNDHTPIHVHVRRGKGKCRGKVKFVLEPAVEFHSGKGFTLAEINAAFVIACQQRDKFIQAWNKQHEQ